MNGPHGGGITFQVVCSISLLHGPGGCALIYYLPCVERSVVDESPDRRGAGTDTHTLTTTTKATKAELNSPFFVAVALFTIS